MTIGVGAFHVTRKMRALVNEVLDTERISYGPMSQQLEWDFANLHECYYAVLSNSGTSSLQVALQALKELHGWRDGDEVIVPALTFVATVNVVLHNRLTPVLVDVDPLWYGISPSGIQDAITPRTRAILPVHTFGQPAQMTRIMEIARRHNLSVVEDSCECMFVGEGVGYQRVGSFGDVGCFSTYVAHLLTTGVGGIATTNNPELAALMRSLVNHGRDGIYISIDDDDASGDRLREIVSRRFRFERIGHSFRITELETALALGQLDGWHEMIAKRNENAAYLTRRLRHINAIQLPAIRPDAQHAFMMYPIVLYERDKRGLVEHLEANGVETREMLPLTNQPCYRGMFREDDYPVAQWINQSGFYVGCHEHLTTDELDYIAAIIGDYFETHQSGVELLQTAGMGAIARS
jgi:dTDP-4-amino-4,6-dideoxygalactose transaminase